jgi:hypothetical protein
MTHNGIPGLYGKISLTRFVTPYNHGLIPHIRLVLQHRPIYYPETPISTQHKAAVRDGLTDDNQGDMGNVMF